LTEEKNNNKIKAQWKTLEKLKENYNIDFWEVSP
jgi:hypothetical protein